jgi:hypothetical protein
MASKRPRVVLFAVALAGAILVFANGPAWTRSVAGALFLVSAAGNIRLSYREEGAGRLDRRVSPITFYAPS